MKDDQKYCELLGQIIRLYLSGYYCEAKTIAQQFLESTPKIESWGRTILNAWNILLSSWEVDEVFAELNKAYDYIQGDDELTREIKSIYVHIMKGWTGYTERMNLRCLREAEDALSLASRSVERLRRDGKLQVIGQIFSHDFWPPLYPSPWPIYWLRGNIRSLMGKSSEASDDFRDATYLLAEAAFEAYGVQLDHQRRIPEDRRSELKQFILQYASQKVGDLPAPARLASRLYNDVGIFLYSHGDFRTATEALKRAVEIDAKNNDGNPYHLSNLGFVLLANNEESEAISPLVQSYQLMEKAKNEWLVNSAKKSTGKDEEYYASGRIYYNLGLLIYKWTRDQDSIPERRRQLLSDKIRNNNGIIRAMFDPEHNTYRSLFQTSAQYYITIRDVSRALPALVMLGDPLKDLESLDGLRRAARELLWEFSYGMGDFVGELAEHKHQIDFYLAPDVATTE
jgi:tetratricopeptide (TPR) repeat protein